ncbi:transposase [Streptomyces diacarni]|uniref:transposase n=1 Tax=Streptomyces diacarni TaxID=2800381 RepID=UPI0033E32F8F
MTPPHARTSSQRGRTPVVRVRGRSRRRISIAALTCYKPGHAAATATATDARASPGATTETCSAHQQLGGPIVLVWDNLNVHKAADLRRFAEARDWLTIDYLPPYAPDPNPDPVEGIWSLLLRGWLSNIAFSTREHLTQRIRRGLRHNPVPQPPHRRLPRRDGTNHQPLRTNATPRVQSR